jgi:hypothetical protein
MIVASLLLAMAVEVPTWVSLPKETGIDPMIFFCPVTGGGFYDLYVRKAGTDDHVRIGHGASKASGGQYNRIVLDHSLRSISVSESATATTFRVRYEGQADNKSVDIDVELSGPLPLEKYGIRTAKFTMTRGGEKVEQTCNRAPALPPGASE